MFATIACNSFALTIVLFIIDVKYYVTISEHPNDKLRNPLSDKICISIVFQSLNYLLNYVKFFYMFCITCFGCVIESVYSHMLRSLTRALLMNKLDIL